MYQIFYEALPLYDPRDPDLIVRDPECHLAVGEAGELSFTIDPDHPYADQIALLGQVSLVADGVTVYRGRIRRAVRDFELPMVVETEGLLACLNDSITPPYDYPAEWEASEDAGYKAAYESGNVVEFFLRWLINQHNAQVGESQQITLGEVTVSDPNNYLYRASESRMPSMDTLKKKLLDSLGGYLVMDYSSPTPVLNYYADLPLTNIQTVDYGENLLDLVTESDATGTYTAILPVGKDGLTIAELPDGELTPGYVKQGELIYSEEVEEARNGQRIVHLAEWKDVTDAEHLQAKALVMLSAEGVKVARTIKVKAIDLGGTGDVPGFRVGRYVQLNSRPHGYSIAYPLTELEPDIFDPGKTQITLGATVKTAADLAVGKQHQTEEELDRQQIELNQQKTDYTQVEQSMLNHITSAIQSSQAIIFEAMEQYVRTSNYEEYQQTVSSQMQILSNEISLRFTEVQSQVTDVDGDLQQTIETLAKYFEFNQDGLTIKAGPNAMQLTLDNDMILFSRNGQQFGHWDGVDFHTGNIVIGVEERAQFGDFAFVPRANGSLSFLKVR